MSKSTTAFTAKEAILPTAESCDQSVIRARLASSSSRKTCADRKDDKPKGLTVKTGLSSHEAEISELVSPPRRSERIQLISPTLSEKSKRTTCISHGDNKLIQRPLAHSEGSSRSHSSTLRDGRPSLPSSAGKSDKSKLGSPSYRTEGSKLHSAILGGETKKLSLASKVEKPKSAPSKDVKNALSTPRLTDDAKSSQPSRKSARRSSARTDSLSSDPECQEDGGYTFFFYNSF